MWIFAVLIISLLIWGTYLVVVKEYLWYDAVKEMANRIKQIIKRTKTWLEIEWKRTQVFNIYQELTPYVDGLKELHLAKYIRFSNNYSVNQDIECFRFEIHGINKEYRNDKRIMKQLIGVKLRDFYRERLGTGIPEIYVTNVQEGEFNVWLTKNVNGIEWLREQAKNDIEKEKILESRELSDEKREDVLVLGWDLEKYENYNLKKQIILNIEKKPSGLVTGASGSGKSFFVTIFLHHLLTVYGDKLDLYYLDFKDSEETRYLSNYIHYYAGDNCSEGLMQYYKVYCEVRDGNKRDGKIRMLMFDEFAGFILWEMQKSKKQAETYRGMVQEVLLMGRSLMCSAWIILQRPDSSFLQGRENFQTTICFLSGGVSNELSKMIGLEEDILQKIKNKDFYNVGEAVVKMDGERTVFMKVPEVKDIEGYKDEILDVLTSTTA